MLPSPVSWATRPCCPSCSTFCRQYSCLVHSTSHQVDYGLPRLRISNLESIARRHRFSIIVLDLPTKTFSFSLQNIDLGYNWHVLLVIVVVTVIRPLKYLTIMIMIMTNHTLGVQSGDTAEGRCAVQVGASE